MGQSACANASLPTPFGLKLSITTYVELFHPICTIELWLDVRECVELVDSDFINAYVNLCKKSCILSHLGNVLDLLPCTIIHQCTSRDRQTWFFAIHCYPSLAMECRQTLKSEYAME